MQRVYYRGLVRESLSLMGEKGIYGSGNKRLVAYREIDQISK